MHQHSVHHHVFSQLFFLLIVVACLNGSYSHHFPDKQAFENWLAKEQKEQCFEFWKNGTRLS